MKNVLLMRIPQAHLQIIIIEGDPIPEYEEQCMPTETTEDRSWKPCWA